MPEAHDMTNEELIAEINACKIVIADNDYKQMKFFRGDMPQDEWQETLDLIHAKVYRINECETELESRIDE